MADACDHNWTDHHVLGVVECSNCHARTIRAAIDLWSDALHSHATCFVTADRRRVVEVRPSVGLSRDDHAAKTAGGLPPKLDRNMGDLHAFLAMFDIAEEFVTLPKSDDHDMH